MRIWLALALVLASALAAQSQNTITVSQGHEILVATPQVLQLTPDSPAITIRKAADITCTVMTGSKLSLPQEDCQQLKPDDGQGICGLPALTTGVKAVFQFTKVSQKACVVVLAPAETDPRNVVIAILAGLTVLLSLFGLRSSPGAKLNEKWKTAFESTLNTVAFAIADAAKPLTRTPGNDLKLPPPPASSMPEDLRARIIGFITLITEWDQKAGRPGRSEVDRVLAELKKLEKKTAIMSPAEVEDRMLTLAREAAKDMLEASDNLYSAQPNHPLQKSLEDTVNAAGLRFFPSKAERLDDTRHIIRARTQAGPNQQRRVISRVIKRGLEDPQGNVISQAEVEIYD